SFLLRPLLPLLSPLSPYTTLFRSLAAGAVLFAAADTYVIVLALPDMMSSVGLDVDELQRAAPVVSGFLLGYVGMLPLIGRISDRSEEHTSELQSRFDLVCRLLLAN